MTDSTDFKLPKGPLEEKLLPKDLSVLDSTMIDNTLVIAGLSELSSGKSKVDAVKWESIGEKNGCKMYSASRKGEDSYLFKGECTLPCSVAVMEYALKTPKCMTLCDSTCKKGAQIKRIDSKHQILYGQYKVGWPAWDRDFCFLDTQTMLKDGIFVSTQKSISCAECPIDKNHVRGEVVCSGYIFRPVKDKTNECLMTYIVQMNANGSIPSFLVNSASKSQAYVPGNFKEKTKQLIQDYDDYIKTLATKKSNEKDSTESKS
eukprot:TRINITY_DN11708_c0_g1_i1.p1 TRINITY_DN11708_c0_g1~~TRINITY_DN11708_c0_g1_i1.p1  ORF type:complete len:261 (+),score=39.93 TRINITY_DN11708_c0_g1_i1:49-831(+)